MKERTDFRVGDKVFCFGLGNGVVRRVSPSIEEPNYPVVVDPVVVEFGEDGWCSFTSDGRRYVNDDSASLFHGEMPGIPHEWTHVDDSPKLSDLRIDDKIMVSGTGNNWLKRRFAGINSCGLPMTFPGGADSWVASGETVAWRRWRLPTKEELNP